MNSLQATSLIEIIKLSRSPSNHLITLLCLLVLRMFCNEELVMKLILKKNKNKLPGLAINYIDSSFISLDRITLTLLFLSSSLAIVSCEISNPQFGFLRNRPNSAWHVIEEFILLSKHNCFFAWILDRLCCFVRSILWGCPMPTREDLNNWWREHLQCISTTNFLISSLWHNNKISWSMQKVNHSCHSLNFILILQCELLIN